MDKCGLLDLGFHGPHFTWTNKSSVWQTTIKEQLDRGLGNADGLMLFPTAEIHHLPRVKFDHCPILLNTDPFKWKPFKPFRFEQMWLTDPTFPPLIQNSWKASELIPFASSSLSRFPRHLEALIVNIRLRNKNHFGNLFQRKTCLLARLRGIQVSLAKKPSAFLYSLEHQLTQDYNTVLHQEYLFWRLKSRIMWLNYGDANIKFFHLKTLQRHSHTRVVTLKDDIGLWLTDEPLTQHIHSAFKKLFQATSLHLCPPSKTDRQICPNSPFFHQAQELARIPQPDEIFRTLQEFPPLKAPGLDGYHALFFQKNWSSLGPSIIQVIQDIFTQHTLPPSWSDTNLALISKVAHPEAITQFRPISLCNTLYKLLSRIIVHRLKPYMAEVINPYQARFVPGRCISNNIIIV